MGSDDGIRCRPKSKLNPSHAVVKQIKTGWRRYCGRDTGCSRKNLSGGSLLETAEGNLSLARNEFLDQYIGMNQGDRFFEAQTDRRRDP